MLSHKRSREETLWGPITVVNVVATASIGRTLDLMAVASQLMNSEYYPKKFAALKLCRADPYAKALVFTSGKIVCVGSVSIEFATDSMNWFVEQIQSTIPDDPLEATTPIVQNIVGTSKLYDGEKQINLLKVLRKAPKNIQYEPVSNTIPPARPSCSFSPEIVYWDSLQELFPGLSYRPDMGKQPVMNVFASGKCTLAGSKSYEDVIRLFTSFRRATGEEICW
tara:strand:+ start:381 stop:1049 length:669 start_codon:yes stop_codon:yes gene_type:complete